MEKRKVVTMLSERAWEAPRATREDLLSWMADQRGYSAEDGILIKYAGDGTYLEDELDIGRIRGESPTDTLELQQKLRKRIKELQMIRDRHENIGKGPRTSIMEPLHQLISRLDLML